MKKTFTEQTKYQFQFASGHRLRWVVMFTVMLISQLKEIIAAPLKPVQQWTSQGLTPLDNTVSVQTDLEWRMSSLLSVVQGDCLIFDIKNPYSASDSYSSFPSFKNNQSISTNCTFTSSHEANCQIVSGQRLQITFTKDNPSRKITGQTISQPFLNPYSTRKFKTVTMSFYSGCKLTNDEGLLIQGTDSISGLQSQTISGRDVTFVSSSRVIADELSNLIVTFQPKTPMKATGQLAISVPGWYVTDTNNDGNKVYSADSVLDEDSRVKILSHISFNITSTVFDQFSRSIVIKYSGDQEVSTPFKLSISNYRNPVNTRPIVGFSVTTLDSEGNLINVSEKELPLVSNLTETARIGEREMAMLGDANGLNIGRIGTYQQISIYLVSQIPLEQNCFWKFTFPKTLKLDSNLSTIQGSGFFKPVSGNYISNTDFTVDLNDNSISIKGCRDPSTLTSKPSGGLVFGVVKIPDYLIPISALLAKTFDDASYLHLIMQTSGDNQGFAFNSDQLQPGPISLDEFTPSNYFAFVQNVNYTILFTPSHSMTNTTRITIDMPEHLIFDTSKPCFAAILISICKFGTKKNQIILTNSFQKDFAGGQQLKVIVGLAQNPQGAREAGQWGITTENMYNDTYYQVDGETSKTSFYAKAGWIQSNLITVQASTYSPSRIDLNVTTEHGVPNKGIVRVDLPKEMVFANFTQNSNMNNYYLEQSGELNYLNMTARYITFQLPTGHAQLTKPITFSLLNVITPRSFRTSSGFHIKSVNIEGYVVDEGGQDITVTMSQMTNLESISIIPMNSTNGLITSYKVEFYSSVLLKSGDIMLLKLPEELTVPNGILCKPADKPQGVFKADCSNVANEIQVKFTNITEDIGNFQFLIAGIRNPASFRQTSTFRDIYFQTSDYFNTTQASAQSLRNLYVQMNNVGLISNYTLKQQTEETGGIGTYEIAFTPANQIGPDGVVTFKWNDQVQLYNDTTCKVMTLKQFDQSFCQLDIKNQQLIISGVFKNSPAYTGNIKIVLDKVRNPLSNRQVEEIEVRTFDDILRLYPIDLLRIKPKLRCAYPCFDCGAEPSQCTSCWQDDQNPFLMITELKSICSMSCDAGWTTNGNILKQCSRCDSSCETCLDSGNVGDRSVCKTCSEAYNFFIPSSYECIGPSCTGFCQSECPTGMYDGGNGVCMECDKSCRTCVGSANECKSCQLNSQMPFLSYNRCVSQCPLNFGASAGVCFKCDSPCATCSIGPSICTSCDGSLGLSLSLGPTCVNQCPDGFITNSVTKKCEGCGAGCNNCDALDNRICLKCSSEFKLYKQTCVSDCPKGYISNFDASQCISLAEKDLKVVYFPFLVLTAILAALSWVGGKVKHIHLVVPNFLVMMGFVENLSLLTQIIMTFRFGTWRYGIPIILAWLFYIIANPVFSFFFKKKIAEVDIYYSKWAKNPENAVTKNVLWWVGSGISWKFYKLMYSHFWGYNIKTVTMQDCSAIRNLQKWFLLFNCCTTYLLVVIMNFVGLIDMDWGTQLYICFIENLIISLLLAGLGGWEQYMLRKKYLMDGMFEPLKKGRQTKLMSGALDTDEEVNATKKNLLKQFKENQVTTQAKFDELMAKFNGRQCMSCCELWYEKEEDPRRIHTWPNCENLEFDGPPQPIKDLFPDNVYADGLTAEQLFMINYLNKNLKHKNEQADKGYSADQNLRQEAELVANKRKLVMANEIEHSTEKKRQRGRKNRFFKQIDNEDNDAGALLDSDEEGNKKAKRAMDAEFQNKKELAAIKEEEEKEIFKQEIEQRRKQKKMQALHLTEENFKLKQKLEQQRLQEQQESREFKLKLAEEEAKLKEIQNKINAKNRENQLRRESLLKAKQNQEEQKADIQAAFDEQRQRNAADNEVRNSVETSKFLQEKALIEKRLQVERYEMDLERKGTGLIQADGKIGKEVVNSNDSATNPHSQLYSMMDKPSMSGAPESTTEMNQQNRSALEMTEPSKRIQMDIRRIECSSEIGEPGTPIYDAASGKLKPSDNSRSNSANARADAVHMSMLQTDEASFIDANQTQPLLFEPDIDYRCFNEIDIVGDLDRDDHGNVLLFLDERTQKSVYIDAKNNPINAYGYLIDKATGDIINKKGQKIFDRRDLDERGNIPMPYSIEKYNFNPFELQGDFTFKDVNDPLSFNRLSQKDQNDNDLEFDDYGRQVNPQGFIIDDNGNLVDREGLVRFDWRQFASHGGLIPKLYNYYGRQFELHDVMGVFDRDLTGKIKLNKGKDEKGKEVIVDKAGYMVNNKGYIINRDGNICTRQGKIFFLNKHLRDSEFPKIFPFTRFNINRVLADFDVGADGQPILKVQGNTLLDKQGRLVNKRGYLVDKNGNVIDIRGKLVFEKNILEENGDIPEIFQINLLRSDSQSSLSRLMSEIDKEQQLFEEGAVGNIVAKQRPGQNASDTSFESMMEDSPSKYDAQNQRLSNASAPADAAKFHISARWADGLPDDIQEESDGDLEVGEVGILRKRKRIKKKAPIGPYVIEEITDRDVMLAQAYGGEAKPRIRKTGQRFATVSRGGDRAYLLTAQQQSRPVGPKIQNLTKDALLNNGVAIAGVQTTKESARKAMETEFTVTGRTALQTQQRARSRDVGRNMPQSSNNMTSAWNDQHNRTLDAQESSRDRNKRSTTQDNVHKSKMAKGTKNVDSRQQNAVPHYDRAFEDEFEKLYKKDIDKFIDGSDFEVESLSGFSDISNPTFKSVAHNPKMKEMEKVYLQRLEFQGLGSIAHEPVKQKKYKAKPRQYLDRFTDDPRQIFRGEQNKMQTGPIIKESPR